VARAAEERKVVTVLFADLTASTEMAARLDPEDLRAVLRPFFDAMANEIDRFGGTLEKFIGDAIVAVFGAPVAHEDDPERAVRAAIAMQSKLGELNERLADVAGGDLAMRIGVNTGEVIAHVGAHGADHALVTGEAVNVAARFQTLASARSWWANARTWARDRPSSTARSATWR
jgi:class 3 adenylate cyclase